MDNRTATRMKLGNFDLAPWFPKKFFTNNKRLPLKPTGGKQATFTSEGTFQNIRYDIFVTISSSIPSEQRFFIYFL